MSKPVVVVGATLGSLLVAALLVLLTWTFALSNVDRGMVKMMWGTFTGNGSFGGQ
jgi:hypothetical protein